jgi:NAD kinase
MNRLTENKIVVVTRPTRLAELVVRFNTVSQARFYVEHQGADFKDYCREDETYHHALVETQTVLGRLGRVQVIDRTFLPNFVFGPEDTVVTLGQDGLVANTVKYLHGQPVVGVNPDPARWDGKLLPFKVGDLKKIIPEVFARRRQTKSVTMAKASLNNGQVMYAVNDLFIGPKSHASARYVIRSGDAIETHSSSGVIVSTGMGSTGWLKSLLTGAAAITQSAGSVLARQVVAESVGEDELHRVARPRMRLNVRTEFAWDASYLFFTVREPFPTHTTGASLVFGRVTPDTPLQLESQMAENGVIFSDGIEKDFLEFNSGTQAVINLAERKGVLVV